MKDRLLQRFTQFFEIEAAGGIVLLACTLSALILANTSASAGYFSLLDYSILGMHIAHWINDGLMAIFFFSVGLEIKREFLEGALSTREQAILPLVAAFGGMVLPATIYFLFNVKTSAAHGWGIPIATDIAFALGVLALFSKRVPIALKVFLAALAIADDIGAVTVIAIFYTTSIDFVSLGIGLLMLATGYLAAIYGVRKKTVYLVLGIFVWYAFLKSGVHATIAGVLLALVIPSEVGKLFEVRLHKWVSFLIIPIFALANAGIRISDVRIFEPISLGIIFGLVFGKQLGILIFSWIAVRLKFAVLPKNVSWKHIYAVSCIAGIGFTMSLFIADLAFFDPLHIEIAKGGIFVASLLAGGLGSMVLYQTLQDKINL